MQANNSEIKIDVPDTIDALYAVPVYDSYDDLKRTIGQAVKKNVPNPVAAVTLRLLDTEGIEIRVISNASLTTLIKRVTTSTEPFDAHKNSLDKTERFALVRVHGKPSWPAAHECVGLACAAALASERRALVIDLHAADTIPPSIALAKLPNERLPLIFANWITFSTALIGATIKMKTIGLARFGLPEIETSELPPELEYLWSLVMTGIAWNLVSYLPKMPLADPPCFVQIPSALSLSSFDIGAAWGQDIAGGVTKVSLSLHIEPAAPSGSVLKITVPRLLDIDLKEYVLRLCWAILPNDL